MTNHTPKHRNPEQTAPTHPERQPVGKRRRSLGPTLSERLKAARSA